MKTTERWKRSATSVNNINYHIIWCPKYRRPVLTDQIETRLKELLVSKSSSLGCQIHTLEVMPDHVHIFISAPPTLAPHFIIQQLKGYSAHTLRTEFPQLKSRLPNMWTRSYYIESTGALSEDGVIRYIEQQKNR